MFVCVVLGSGGEVWYKIIQLGKIDDILVEMFHIYVKNVKPWLPISSVHYGDLGLVGNYYRMRDDFGIELQMPKDYRNYYDLYQPPLANAERIKIFNFMNA